MFSGLNVKGHFWTRKWSMPYLCSKQQKLCLELKVIQVLNHSFSLPLYRQMKIMLIHLHRDKPKLCGSFKQKMNYAYHLIQMRYTSCSEQNSLIRSLKLSNPY